ncbi:MAG: hypothetical protein KJT03_18560, partial [Verrucomicrobiae bacterium]|nr:hypothetical protein [Verrucomicrobiae bacterium]
MNFRFLPAVSVIASLILPSKLLFSAIEFVPSPVFPRSPSANFAYGEDESLQLTVSVRGMEVDLNAIAVSVTNGNGKTVKARATSTPGVFEIQPSEEGLLKVRMEPPASLSGELASGEADVYFGNYDEGMRKLETRRKKLGVLPKAIGLLEAQIEDQRLWLEHWLQEQGKESHLGDKAPVQGQLATAFRLAWDLVSQHEKGKKAVMREWGKQLPARRSFMARAAGAKREVGFDYILRIPEDAPKKQYPLVVIVHGFTAN